MGVRPVTLVAVGVQSHNCLSIFLDRFIPVFNIPLCGLLLVRRGRWSQKGAKLLSLLLNKRRSTLPLLSNGSHMGGVHPASVIIAEVAIVNGDVVSVHRTSQCWLSLVGQVLRALGPCMLCRFVQERGDRATIPCHCSCSF